MSESTIILAKESISDGREVNEINEIRPLSNEEIEVYDTQKNILTLHKPLLAITPLALSMTDGCRRLTLVS